MARSLRVVPCGDPLAVTCDTEELTFTAGGDGAWFAQTAEYNYDGDAAQSGDIGDDQEVWLSDCKAERIQGGSQPVVCCASDNCDGLGQE